MADGQDPRPETATPDTPRPDSRIEEFRLDAADAARRDEAAERARDYGSLDQPQGESDPANPNLHYGSRTFIDPGTDAGTRGAPVSPDDGGLGALGQSGPAPGTAGPDADGTGTGAGSAEGRTGGGAPLADTGLDATLATGIDTLDALTARIARLSADADGLDAGTEPGPVPAGAPGAAPEPSAPAFAPVGEDDTAAETPVNRPPTDVLLDNTGVLENAAPGTVVAVLSAIDPDSGEVFTYEIAGGSDLFEVVGNAILVKEGAELDHESLASVDLPLIVRDSAGNTYAETVTLEIRDVNEVATDIALDNASVAENAAGAAVGTLTTTDPDAGDTQTYTVSDDRFEVVDGQLKLKDGVALDHETAESVSVEVTATDAGGLARTETFDIAVGDVNEVATDIALDNASVAENAAGAVVGALSVTDPDAGDTHTYTVSDDRFEVVDGQLKLKDGVALDHETAESVSVEVTATDAGGLARTETFDIAVGDVNEVATDIALDNASVAENAAGAVVGALSVTDPDADDTHTYTVSDDRFEVVDGQLKLKDGVALDHETAESVSVEVTATDAGGLARTETFDIAVGDVNEVATDIALDNASVAENAAGAVVGALSATDPDAGDTHTYTVSDDRFEVVDGQLKLKDGVALDHETAESISVDVTATDAGGLARTETFDIAVADVNEAPVDIALAGETAVTERAAAVEDSAIATGNGGGSDSSIVTLPGGADARVTVDFARADNSFELVVNGESLTGKTIQLQANVYDPGTQAFLQFADGSPLSRPWVAGNDGVPRIQAVISEDGVQFFGTRDPSSSVLEPLELVNGDVSPPAFLAGANTVTVINPDDHGPDGVQATVSATYTELATGVAENEAGAIVGTLSTSDPDAGDTHTYTVSDDRFEVVDGQLKLKDGVALDHEAAETITVEVTTTDAGGLSYSESFDIAVGDVNEAATDIALDNASVAENAAGAVVGALSVTDPDAGDTHTYAVSDDRFEVVDGQLKLKDGVALDHETAESVSVDVTATDAGGLARTETFDIAVGDANEVATDIALDNASVAENAAGAVVGTLSTTDPDAGDTHTYAVSDDRFEVVDGQLRLKDGVALDHETADSISVDVTATDAGGLARTETFDIAVADVNEAPLDISLGEARLIDPDFAEGDGFTSGTSISERGLETPQAVVAVSFTTGDDVTATQTLFETGGRGTGLNIVIDDGQLKVFAGSGNDLELSAPIEPGTSYNIALELDKANDSLKLLLSDDLPLAAMTEENSLVASQTGWTDHDWDGGDGVGIGQRSGSTQGNIDGNFQGTIDGDGAQVFANATLDTIRTGGDPAGVEENEAGAVVGTLTTTDPDAGDTHTYAVSDDRFEVVDGQLKLKDGVALDHETADSISVEVTATDAGGLARTETFEIAVGDVNEVATDIALDNASVAENAAGAVVGALSVTDPDAGDMHTYAVSDDRFEVVDGQLKLKDGIALDHETADSISVDVTATDAGGLGRTETFDIAVGDVNEVATDIALDNASVAENAAGAAVGTLATADPDAGDTHTYTVSDDRFEVVDGQLKLKDGVALDHETADSISVDVTATDAGGLSRTETFEIAVGDVNEVATDIALDNASVAENAAGAVVGALSVTDPDAGDTHTYTVSDDRFEVVDGQLKLKDGVALDHETADSISVDVTATDAGGLSRTETFEIAVGDVNEVATDIALDNSSVAENAAGAVVGALSVTDPDAGDTHTYTVSDDRFEVVDGQLKLKDGVALDHETADSISVEVTATDAGGLARTETFEIAVGDVNEVATDIALDNAFVAENAAGAVVGALSVTDPDADDTHTYTVSDDRFEVVDGQLKLKDGVALDHETAESVSVEVTATDAGGLARTETFDIAVGDVNEVATDIALDNASVAENAAGAVVGALSVTDPDAGDTHTYMVSDDRFEVVEGQLKLKDGVALDHDAADSISVEVTATDAGGLSRTETFDIAVADANEAPIDIDIEGTAATTVTVTFQSETAGYSNSLGVFHMDADGNPVAGEIVFVDGNALTQGDTASVTFEGVDAADIGYFLIPDGADLNDGLTAGTRVNFVQDGDGNWQAVTEDGAALAGTRANVLFSGDGSLNPGGYDQAVEDGASISFEDQSLGGDADFTDFVFDTEISATPAGLSVAENEAGAVVGAISTTDPDAGDTHTYSVSDDRFEVVDGQLKLKDGVALDHETAETVSVEVTTTDAGGLSYTESFDIAVGDANEAATDIALDNASVAENAAGAVVGALSTTDPDAGDTHTYTVSDDRFEVVDGQLKLKDGIALDHESEASVSVEVTATDAGGLARTESFDIAVGDVDEVASAPALDIGSTQRVVFSEDFEGWTGSVIDEGGDHLAAQNGWESDGVVEIRDTGADGNGSEDGSIHHAELNNDPTGTYDDAPNLARSVDTVDGGTYTVTFDYAPRPGYDDSVNRIEVVWDGEVVATISADGTGDSDLNWQTHTLTLTGDGDPAEIEFREAGTDTDYGRGMMLDNIQMVESLDGAANGSEGGAIALPAIDAALTDTDGSETLAVAIGNIPAGAVLTDGANTFTAAEGDTQADVSGWDLGAITLTPPAGFSGTANLTVTATSTESEGGATSVTSATLDVHVQDGAQDDGQDDGGPRVLWSEDFSGLADGAGSDSGDTAWGTDESATGTTPTHGVDEGEYRFSRTTEDSNDDGAVLRWQSEAIDISGMAKVDLNFDLRHTGDMEEGGSWHDFFKAYAVIDGERTEIMTQDGDSGLAGGTLSFADIGTGSELVIEFEAKTTSVDESFFLDNVSLVGTPAADGDSGGVEDDGGTPPDPTHAGTGGEDKITGTDGDDVIYGYGDDDKLKGEDGDDTIYGGAGDDKLEGKDGDDTLYGESGDDELKGGKGDDVLNGGAGNDELKGEDGNDILRGGAGDDELDGGKGDDVFLFGMGDGSDEADGGGGGWTDTIRLENADGSSLSPDNWTLSLDEGSIASTEDGAMVLSDGAEGVITLTDGSEISFEGIERIEW